MRGSSQNQSQNQRRHSSRKTQRAQKTRRSTRVVTATLTIITVILILVLALILAQRQLPLRGAERYVGLALHTIELNKEYTTNASEELLFERTPLSLSISGTFTGKFATIDLRYNGEQHRIVEINAENTNNTGQNNTSPPISFSQKCEQCTFTGGDTRATLNIAVEGILLIKTVSYETQETKLNTPPLWNGRTVFVVDDARTFAFDLSRYVYDGDNDTLSFTIDPQFSIFTRLNGSQLSFIPNAAVRGEHRIEVTVSDGVEKDTQELVFFIVGELAERNETKGSGPQIDPQITDELYRNDKARVIVVVNETEKSKKESAVTGGAEPFSVLGAAIALFNFAVAQSNPDPITITNNFESNNLLIVDITSEGLKKLESNENIIAVYADPLLSINLEESRALVSADPFLHTADTDIILSGKGQAVCVIDTGVAPHLAFEDRIVQEACFCSASDLGYGGCCSNGRVQDTSAEDDSLNSHGTKVAGIIAANGEVRGVAPSANIVAVKVCDFLGRCRGSDLIAGIDYCTNNKERYNIVSISASLGDGKKYANDAECPQLFEGALIAARDAAIIPVFSSGNEFYRGGIGSPACSPQVISVGATTKSQNSQSTAENRNKDTLEIAGFTNLGPNLDMLAPGVDIMSTARSERYSASSGTSMASPFVAGAIALLAQEQELLNETQRVESNLTTKTKNAHNEQILRALIFGGEKISDYSFLNIKGAVELLGQGFDTEFVRELNKNENKESAFTSSTTGGERKNVLIIPREDGREERVATIKDVTISTIINTEELTPDNLLYAQQWIDHADGSQTKIAAFKEVGSTELIETSTTSGEPSQEYIVEFAGPPIAEYRAELQEGGEPQQNLEFKTKAYENTLRTQHLASKESIERLNVSVDYDLDTVFNGVITRIPEGKKDRIKDNIMKIPGVVAIYPSITVNVVLNQSVPLIEAPTVWTERVNDVPLTGQGVKIAIIDTGVDYTHPDLGSCFGANCKVIGGYDFVNNDNNPMDDHGHGTHVAATAAGKGSLLGVAPDAQVIAYKVLNSGGSGSSTNIIKSIEAAVKDGAHVISMSLGGGGTPDSPMSVAANNAMKSGAIVTVAAGNSGPSKTTILSPGNAPDIITVGATDKNDVIASFSSRGPTTTLVMKPDLTAPGVNICAAQFDSWYDSKKCGAQHISISGTSMATPHVAGAAALLRQKYPALSSQEIKSLLVSTAKDLKYPLNTQGGGRINVAQAVKGEIIFDPPLITISELTESTKNRIISIKNIGTENTTVSITPSTFSDGSKSYSNLVIVSPPIVTVPAGSSVNVTASMNLSDSFSGAFEGMLKMRSTNTAGRVQNYTMPVFFNRIYQLTISFVDENNRAYNPSLVVIHNDDMSVLESTSTINSGKVTFKIPASGKINYHGLWHSTNRSALPLLSGQINLTRSSNVTLSMANAEKYTLPLQDFNGNKLDALSLNGWITLQGTNPAKNVKSGQAQTNSLLHNSPTIYLNNYQNPAVSRKMSLSYIGLPERGHLILSGGTEGDQSHIQSLFARAEERYFIAHSLGTNQSVDLSLDRSRFGTYIYTHNYLTQRPDYYDDNTQWIDPSAWYSNNWWIPSYAPLKTTHYIQANGFGQEYYIRPSYNDPNLVFSNNYARMGGRTEIYEPQTTWPPGVRAVAGENKSLFYHTSPYSPVQFANTYNIVRFPRSTLMDKSELVSLRRQTQVYWYDSLGTRHTEYLELPRITIFNADTNATIFDYNLTFWGPFTYYLPSGTSRLHTILRADPAYPLFNMTIESWFNNGYNPPMISAFNITPNFDPNQDLDFVLSTSSAQRLQKATVAYRSAQNEWIDSGMTLSGSSIQVHIPAQELKDLQKLSLKISLEQDSAHRSEYLVNGVSIAQRPVRFGLNTNPIDTTTLRNGSLVTIRGSCSDSAGATCANLIVKYYINNKYIKNDLILNSGQFAYVHNFTGTSVFTVVFEGTGHYARHEESITLGSQAGDTNPPTVDTLSVSPSTIYNDVSPKLSATITDNVAVIRAQFFHNAEGTVKNYSATKNGQLYEYTLPAAFLQNQERVTWYVSATDGAGNTANSSLQTFSVQNRKPSFNSTTQITVYEESLVNATITPTDPDGDRVTISYAAPLNNLGLWQTRRGNAGTYQTNISASDGIVIESKNLTITVLPLLDTTPPRIGNISMSPQTIYNDISPKLSAAVTDNIALARVQVFHNAEGSMKNYSTQLNGSRYEYNLPAAHLQNQERVSWYLSAADTAGNSANSSFQSFFVENRRPIIYGIPPFIIYEGILVNATIFAFDPDYDRLSYAYAPPLNSLGLWQTKLGDAGIYRTGVAVSDGISVERREFNITVLPLYIPPNQTRLNDTEYIKGDLREIFLERISQLNLSIDGNYNYSQRFAGRRKIKFEASRTPLFELFHNFSQANFNLSAIKLKKLPENETKGGLIIRGIPFSQERKTAYIDRKNTARSTVCIKDADIDSFEEISSGCNSSNEYFLICDGIVRDGYTCMINSTLYTVSGLRHSGVIETCVPGRGVDCGTETPDGGNQTPPVPTPTPSPSSGSGSSGGGGGGGSSSGEPAIIPLSYTFGQELPVSGGSEEEIGRGEEQIVVENTVLDYENKFAELTKELCTNLQNLTLDEGERERIVSACKDEALQKQRRLTLSQENMRRVEIVLLTAIIALGLVAGYLVRKRHLKKKIMQKR